MLILIKLYLMRNSQQDSENISRYGYLYLEFKSEFFFWEIIRLFFKFALIGGSFFALVDPMTRGFILLVMLVVYYMSIIRFKPFRLFSFLKLELDSIKTFIISLMLAAYVDKSTNYWLRMFSIGTIAVVNGYYIYTMVKKMVNFYYLVFVQPNLGKLEEALDKLKNKKRTLTEEELEDKRFHESLTDLFGEEGDSEEAMKKSQTIEMSQVNKTDTIKKKE
eukprot:TRINITY_DN8755_c0_g1_i4.p1 TRINITY_DN8755_c0_g1~~TRINITY_DN8755_c0_g1_i4.p1  ORF type:complete len:220 (-),score=53.56 TRINITY_DN8755_c0_g1_i4:109-768(-)